jgi:uncharacterized protein
MDRIDEHFCGETLPTPDQVTSLSGRHATGGHRAGAAYLLDRGADLNWIGYDRLTPLEAAQRSNASELSHGYAGSKPGRPTS